MTGADICVLEESQDDSEVEDCGVMRKRAVAFILKTDAGGLHQGGTSEDEEGWMENHSASQVGLARHSE